MKIGDRVTVVSSLSQHNGKSGEIVSGAENTFRVKLDGSLTFLFAGTELRLEDELAVEKPKFSLGDAVRIKPDISQFSDGTGQVVDVFRGTHSIYRVKLADGHIHAFYESGLEVAKPVADKPLKASTKVAADTEAMINSSIKIEDKPPTEDEPADVLPDLVVRYRKELAQLKEAEARHAEMVERVRKTEEEILAVCRER